MDDPSSGSSADRSSSSSSSSSAVVLQIDVVPIRNLVFLAVGLVVWLIVAIIVGATGEETDIKLYLLSYSIIYRCLLFFHQSLFVFLFIVVIIIIIIVIIIFFFFVVVVLFISLQVLLQCKVRIIMRTSAPQTHMHGIGIALVSSYRLYDDDYDDD